MTIAVELAVSLAALLVEHEHLVALDERGNHFANYLCTFYRRSADGYVAVVVNEQHLFKFNSLAVFSLGDVVNEELLALFCLELLTVNLYDCVHFNFV